ncbi:hypothetical protein QFC19_001488 [Naganishia cerealis]|uniref:Uncharacterized protein n=1 Tax=Naganishia cerealis TaxID=610337 RepID=A0ACC2WHH7_9TREE|nr:hypothetical protein QFC19_001488 [Naganishia cerealis]
MAFTLRATYKDTTRNLAIPPGEAAFPAYDQIITKVLKAFDLPDGAQIALWHVYFSKNDDFRKRVMTVLEWKLKEKETKRSEESLAEITKYLAAYRARHAAAMPTPVGLTPASPRSLDELNDHPYDPVPSMGSLSRNSSTASSDRTQSLSVSHLFPDLDDVMRASRSASTPRSATGQLNASRTTRTPSPALGAGTPSSGAAPDPQTPTQPSYTPPNFATLFSTAAQVTTAATHHLSADLRSTAVRASHELRSNAIIQGATLTNELKGVLEGFLEHLGGQLATFEDGMRDKLDLGARTATATGNNNGNDARRESEGGDGQQQQQQHMPGAFRTTPPAAPYKDLPAAAPAVHAATMTSAADTSKDGVPASVAIAYVHANKVCDVCDLEEKVFDFKKAAANVFEERHDTAHNANCDVCRRTIIGPRHKCLKCPDVPMHIEIDASTMGPSTGYRGHGAHHPQPAGPPPGPRGPYVAPNNRQGPSWCDRQEARPSPRAWRGGRAEAATPPAPCGLRARARPWHHHGRSYLDPSIPRSPPATASAQGPSGGVVGDEKSVSEEEAMVDISPSVIAGIKDAFGALPTSSKSESLEKPASVKLDDATPAASPKLENGSMINDTPKAATLIIESAADASASHPLAQVERPALNVAFVDDVSIPDGTPLPPAAEFTKVWKLENTGNAVIPAGTAITFVGGENFAHKQGTAQVEEDVAVGAKFLVALPGLRAPGVSGETYTGFWRLSDGQGQMFGDRLWTEIHVVEPASKEGSLHSSSLIIPTDVSASTHSNAAGTVILPTSTSAPDDAETGSASAVPTAMTSPVSSRPWDISDDNSLFSDDEEVVLVPDDGPDGYAIYSDDDEDSFEIIEDSEAD